MSTEGPDLLQTNPKEVMDECVRILVKIANNIIDNPDNGKVRNLQKGNFTIRTKLVGVPGGRECLKSMGFLETDTIFTLPTSAPLQQVETVKNQLLNLGKNDIKPTLEATPDGLDQQEDVDKISRFILPPLQFTFQNPFLKQIESFFHKIQAYNDKSAQKRAKDLIPLTKLTINAQMQLRTHQEQIKKDKLPDPGFFLDDFILLELLTWFKEEFFTWVDTLPCEKCGERTTFLENGTPCEFADRVEIHKCEKCSHGTRFPRYNDLNLLMETRKGRCGEWAQMFTFMCLSLGYDARFVMDQQDHVWTEVFSNSQGRWLHCDSCENVCDSPLMYESGWGKKLTYVIAYSPEEIQDVSWRYSSHHNELIKRRNLCTEKELINALITLRRARQESFTTARIVFLTKRLVCELMEFFTERQPNEKETFGRISGSKEWRSTRGEIGYDNLSEWVIEDQHIINDTVTIKYSTAKDAYYFVRGDGKVTELKYWDHGVLSYKAMFRKEEKDWKTVYLARTEGADTGAISWTFRLLENSQKVIDTLSLTFTHKTYENGSVDIRLNSGNISEKFSSDEDQLTTKAFSGLASFSIDVKLSGGKGDVAWQHSQLFRQSTDAEEFPFILKLTFKSMQ